MTNARSTTRPTKVPEWSTLKTRWNEKFNEKNRHLKQVLKTYHFCTINFYCTVVIGKSIPQKCASILVDCISKPTQNVPWYSRLDVRKYLFENYKILNHMQMKQLLNNVIKHEVGIYLCVYVWTECICLCINVWIYLYFLFMLLSVNV